MNFVCQHCNHAKATVHITDMSPKKRERHLCEECAEKEGVIIKQHTSTTNAILQKFLEFKAQTGSGSEGPSCSKCGRTFQEFQVKGLLGCPHDYEEFRSVLEPLLQRAHEKATQHVGKVPGSAGDSVQAQTGLLRLRRQLQEAIEREDYELAARLRDQIRAGKSA